MLASHHDFTGQIGPLIAPSEAAPWPMFAFHTPAYEFWNGVANGLKKRGLTDEQIKNVLQSKAARWLMDAEGHRLAELGYLLAEAIDVSCADHPA